MAECFAFTKELQIYMDESCRFTTDAVLLSDFAAPKPQDRACDLCSGSGAVALLWQDSERTAPSHTTCVEISSDICALLQQTIDCNNLSERMTAVCADLRELRVADKDLFDLVTCNPPYFHKGSGKIGAKGTARHQLLCDTEELFASIARILKYGGRTVVCQRPERLCDILYAMRQNGIEPKKLRLCAHRADKEPFLLLVEGKKGAKSGMRLLPTLLLEQDGAPTDEYKRIYKSFFEVR